MATATARKKTAAKKPAARSATKTIDMADIMAEMRRLSARVEATEDENERLRNALQEAKDTGAFIDEFGQKVVILDRAMMAVNNGIHDRAGTIPEKLDIMEKVSKINKQPFDRERTRKILMGEEVEDLSEYICERCGRSETKWNTNPSLFEAHVQAHITGKNSAYGKRKQIRAVDAEDDEERERALFEKLFEKYGTTHETDSGLVVAAAS